MKLPDFSFEEKLSLQGYRIIAGVDEVGRGCFAGPVVAGCVVFNGTSNLPSVLVNDSKKLTAKQREAADIWIRENAAGVGVGLASTFQINRHGIKKATEIAYRQAIKNCRVKIDFLLIDAFYAPYVKGLRRKNQKPIIGGDGLSISIAAASIVAKVYRDKLMTTLAAKPKFKKYMWHKNKGYGTREHRESILKYGTTQLHREQFVETWLSRI
jgi:ribonuclease HII